MKLVLNNSNLQELPKKFNDKLTKLDFSNNQIISLNNVHFPCNLQVLNCSGNQITTLNKVHFPTFLETIIFSFNQLTKISNLPNSLKKLACIFNQITKIENLPNSLEFFCGNNNQIRVIENLPLGLKYFFYDGNPIEYVDNVKYSDINFTLTGYQAIHRIQKRMKRRYKIKNDASRIIGRQVLHWLHSAPNGILFLKNFYKISSN